MPRPRKPASTDWPTNFLAALAMPPAEATRFTVGARRVGDHVALDAKIPGANFGSPVALGVSFSVVKTDPEMLSLVMTPEQARHLALSLLEAAE